MATKYIRKYRADGKGVNTIEASIYYSLGGYNYFTHENEVRGYWFSLTPFEDKDGWRSYTAFSGSKTCVLECPRQSAKRFAEVKGMMPELLEKYLAKFCKESGIELVSNEYTEVER